MSLFPSGRILRQRPASVGLREVRSGTGGLDWPDWRLTAVSAYYRRVNEESLKRANAFLEAVSRRVQPGEILEATPADIGHEVGFEQPLASARAVRALMARKRLEAVDGKYRLLDATPVAPDEPEAIPRKPRKRKAAGPRADGKLTYSEVGQAAIDRLIELGKEVASLRAGTRVAKEEARESRRAQDDAERRARDLSARVHDLEAKLDMAEQNLRTLLVAAKGGSGGGAEGRPVGDVEMEAILGVLKSNGGEGEDAAAVGIPSAPSAGAAQPADEA